MVSIDRVTLARANKEVYIATASPQVTKDEIIGTVDISALQEENTGTLQKYAAEKVIADS